MYERSVAALLASWGYEGDPAELVRWLVAHLHDVMFQRAPLLEDLPINVGLAASCWHARVDFNDSDIAGSIRWVDRGFVIAVPASDREPRRRFSIAHEIIHIPFMQASATNGLTRVDASTGEFDHASQEERLCDLGAAELLMPAAALAEHLPAAPSMEDVLWVANVCDTGIEAAARRVLDLSGIPGSVVVLEPSHKPSEDRDLRRRRQEPALPGFEFVAPRPRLRVKYAIDAGLGKIWKMKSFDDSSELAQDVLGGGVDATIETGLLPGAHHVSARQLPYRRDGKLVERVVMLVFDARRWAAAA